MKGSEKLFKQGIYLSKHEGIKTDKNGTKDSENLWEIA